MVDKLMYIPNDDKQNYPFFRLQLVVNKIWTLEEPRAQELLIQQKRKRYYKTLGV